MVVKVRKLATRARVPVFATSESAGADLTACLDAPLTIKGGAWVLVPTGISIELPNGYEGQVRPRSGLAARGGLTVLNSPGTIDSDYRGEVGVLLINHGSSAVVIEDGDRIAQLVIARCERPTFEIADELTASERGEGGFGSTGV